MLRMNFSRDSATPCDDETLRRIAAQLKSQYGVMACVPFELHQFAADKLSSAAHRLVLTTGVAFDAAMSFAMRDAPHLRFLATCERSDDARQCDVTLEGSDR